MKINDRNKINANEGKCSWNKATKNNLNNNENNAIEFKRKITSYRQE